MAKHFYVLTIDNDMTPTQSESVERGNINK